MSDTFKNIYLPILWMMLIVFTNASLQAQSFGDELQSVKTENNLIGLAVGVRCGNSELATFYGGWSDVDSGIPIDENTMYRVASISKSFTAAGLMILYDQGLFQLDDDISEALGYEVRNPAFPDVLITYRMLLSHQSSLQDGGGYGSFLSATYQNDPTPDIQEVLLENGAYFTPNMWRTEMPGTYFAYSNLNYGLIGTLIEALSGERFDEFMSTHLLEPLNINGGYNVSELNDIESLAVLYRDNIPQADDYGGVAPDPFVSEDYIPGTNGSLFAPQGGLRCTLEDLLDFAHMLSNQGNFEGTQLLSAEAVEAILNTEWDYDGTNGDNYFGLFNRWGLGIHHSGANGTNDRVVSNEILMGHPGEAYGLISDLYFHSENGYTIAFVTNGYASGGGYSFGEETIYYLPEEQTFSLAEDFFWDACSTLRVDVKPPQKFCEGLNYNLQSNELIVPENFLGSRLEVYSPEGKVLKKDRLTSNRYHLSEESPFTIIHISGKESTCRLKAVNLF